MNIAPSVALETANSSYIRTFALSVDCGYWLFIFGYTYKFAIKTNAWALVMCKYTSESQSLEIQIFFNLTRENVFWKIQNLRRAQPQDEKRL